MKSMIQALATLLLMGAVLTGCAEDTWFQDENVKEGTYTMTVQASMCSEVTRALSPNGSTINASWAEGEVVTVYNVTRNADLSGTLVAKSSGTSTTLKGQLTGTIVAGDQLKLKFLSPTYSSQDGTLTGTDNSIDKVCDYAEATVTVSSVTDGYVMTTTSASFTNQQSIVKFTLLDKGNGDAAINPTSLTISDGTSTVNLFDIPSATYTTNSNGVLYVAFPAAGTAKTISLNVIGGSNHYFYEKSDVTFTNNNFYDVTVKLGSIGALPGKFTINAGGGQVSFSQGNLQYQASTSTWRFATNQYDFVGDATVGNVYENETKCNNASIGGSYSGWIDLFGWGTGNNPTNSSTNNNDYGTFTDWGVNAISNGGNTADLWRTLSKDEWVYLFANHTKGWSNVNGVYGYVIRPDGVSTAVAASYTASGWAVEEAAGSVFLHAAGSRGGTSVGGVGAWGDYWSSTPYDSNNAYYLYFNSSQPYPSNNTGRFGGRSVRLVYDAPLLGTGTEEDPYMIYSVADWNILSDKVNAGNTFSGKFICLCADIGTAQSPITRMIGIHSDTESNCRPFSGTFDGQGHTLTIDYSSNDYETRSAPFSRVSGATIRNLIVAGNCGSAGRAAGIVGECNSLTTVINCISSVTVSGGPFIGGISIGGYYHIEGCLFNGTINATGSGGGLVGYGEPVTQITNCLFAPQDGSSISGGTFYHTGSGGATVTNCYYQTLLGDAQGKQARSITAGTDVTINNLGDGTEYNVSGITAYTHGIKYNGVYYAGNGEAVSLSLSHGAAPSGYTFGQYTVTGGGSLDNPTSNSPTLTMTDADQTIGAEWIPEGAITFNYIGAVQTFTALATGYYTLTCYGAQGGYSSGGLGGKGGLSQLTYQLTKGDVLYIYAGGQGECIDGSSSHPEGGDGGWNGGGKGGTGVAWGGGNGDPYNGGGGGGGATHIATSAIGPITESTSFTDNHNNLLLIAGGGGGGLSWGPSAGGAGGGDTGGNGHRGNDEWNIAWNNGTLSCGRDGMTSSTGSGSCEGCGGGGGGYQGGNTWTVTYNASNQSYSGAGGSSWGETTNGKGYTTTTGGATEGGNGRPLSPGTALPILRNK